MISYDLEELFRQDSVKKDLEIVTTDGEITLTNENIYQESLSILESICSDDYMVFGSCDASEIKFTTSCLDSLKGKTIVVKIILNNNVDDPFVVGTYLVDEDKLTADRSKREIVAYDSLYRINNADVTSWYEGLTFPLTLKQLRDSFFTYFGIEQVAKTLINDSISVSKTIEANQISGADIIQAICEINCVFGHITRDNKFKYIELQNNSQYSITPSIYKKVEYEDYSCQQITGVQIRTEEYDIGVQVGTNDNPYVIEGNILVAGYSTEELTPVANVILTKLSALQTYKPCKIECIGNLCVEVGDRISVQMLEESAFNTWVMSRTINGIQALYDSIEASGEEKRSAKMNGVHYELVKLKGKANVLERSIEETRSEIYDVAAQTKSEIKQTTDSLSIEIESLQAEIDNEILYYESEGRPTLLNYPYWDFCTNIPCNNTVQTTNDLKFEYTEDNRNDHMRDLCFDTVNLISYRFVKMDNEWLWKEIADTEATAIMERVSKIEVTTKDITSSVSQIEADLSGNYYTKVQTDTKIEQTATDITSTVNKQINKANGDIENLSTSLQQTDSKIEAKVSKTGQNSSNTFSWNLTSNDFTLKSNGSVVFVCNASGIKVSGEIVASSGKIGQWSVDSNGMYFQGSGGKTVFQADGNIVCYDSSNNVKWYLNCNGTAFISGYVTTQTLEANYVKTSTLTANYATINQLNGVNAKFNNLNASNITAGTLSVSRLDVNGIFSASNADSTQVHTKVCQTKLLQIYDGTIYRTCYLSGGYVRYQ